MALTVTVDATKTPVELTVTSDRRITPTPAPISGTVESAGETASWTAVFAPVPFKPIVVKNADGTVRPHTSKSDNGTVAVVAI